MRSRCRLFMEHKLSQVPIEAALDETTGATSGNFAGAFNRLTERHCATVTDVFGSELVDYRMRRALLEPVVLF